ncbi:hypothetical protein VSR68_12180 [Paraburkholderia phymatum]|uniref:hypothetical protein n=1 Tax=Paraburkholderia phymatum TaxID=148447 RepID=UPI00316D35EC
MTGTSFPEPIDAAPAARGLVHAGGACFIDWRAAPAAILRDASRVPLKASPQ